MCKRICPCDQYLSLTHAMECPEFEEDWNIAASRQGFHNKASLLKHLNQTTKSMIAIGTLNVCARALDEVKMNIISKTRQEIAHEKNQPPKYVWKRRERKEQ